MSDILWLMTLKTDFTRTPNEILFKKNKQSISQKHIKYI